MLSRINEQFAKCKNAKDALRFLQEVDHEDHRKGQTYVDGKIAKDVPKEIAHMLDVQGFRGSLTSTTPKLSVKYLAEAIKKATMEHLVKTRKDTYSATLIRPMANVDPLGVEEAKSTTQVATTSWWAADPTGDKSLERGTAE